MCVGAALLIGALSLFLYNIWDDTRAGTAAEAVLGRVMEEIEARGESEPVSPPPAVSVPQELQTVEDRAMTEVEIDGYNYIGYLSVPALGLELPVMADWDYQRLKIAPCRYYGSSKSDDLVIMAHSYRQHFGYLSTALEGTDLYFTDMDGATSTYRVVTVQYLSPQSVEEVTAGEYDLTLFTCTYGGGSRLTVFCDRVKTQ